MTTRVWQGQADATAQVSQATVTGYDATTTYGVLVGGEQIATTIAAGTAIATAAALASGWNVSTSPYADTITALATGATFKATADVAGVPFVFTTLATGGTGAWSAVTTPTANEGPNDWNTPENWSGDTVPISTDDVVCRDSDVDIRWGLDQAAVDLASLVIEQTYTGKIGLDRTAVVTGADGSVSTEKPEYRQDYLDIGWDECRIGEILGPGTPAGSSRLKLDNDRAAASLTTIYNTGSSSADINLPAVRLLAANASADIQIRSAPGGVGIAVDDPAETSTVGDINVSDDTPATQVFVGLGTTLTNYTQQGGANVLRAAATVTLVDVLGGELATEGDGYSITTLSISGGTAYPNHTPTGGNAIGTVNINGGTVDGTRSREARTWGTVGLNESGGTLIADSNVVTITTLTEPDALYTLSVG